MFVIRIIPDLGDMDVKAFQRRPDADDRFNRGWQQANDGEFQSIALFEVDTDDARAACEAVRSADTTIRLLNIKESESAEIKKLLPKLDFDI